jgi:very-short-patch-repair endonuclease
MIECQICKRQLGALSGKHLVAHGITAAEYREQFPGHHTREQKPVSEETRAKMRASRTGYTHSDETKDKIGAKHRGKKRSPEEIDKWRDSYAHYLEENGSPMLGMDRGDAFKKRMSEVAKARSPEQVREKVEQMWAARRGSKATDEQRERYSQARLKFMLENPDKLSPKMFDTRPEREFAAELDKRLFIYRDSTQILKSNEYARSFHLTNRVYDFKIGEGILIEIDGPYHREARFHGGNGATDEQRQAILNRIIERDQGKDKLARDNGYRIYRIAVTNKLVADGYIQLKTQGFDHF